MAPPQPNKVSGFCLYAAWIVSGLAEASQFARCQRAKTRTKCRLAAFLSPILLVKAVACTVRRCFFL